MGLVVVSVVVVQLHQLPTTTLLEQYSSKSLLTLWTDLVLHPVSLSSLKRLSGKIQGSH